jgi:tripartite-type tricarboxylate transporter receptor subunit TctC
MCAAALRALAVAGPKRSALLPDVPTLKEAGVDGVDVTQWYGFLRGARCFHRRRAEQPGHQAAQHPKSVSAWRRTAPKRGHQTGEFAHQG